MRSIILLAVLSSLLVKTINGLPPSDTFGRRLDISEPSTASPAPAHRVEGEGEQYETVHSRVTVVQEQESQRGARVGVIHAFQ